MKYERRISNPRHYRRYFLQHHQEGGGPTGIAPEQNPQAELANKVISNIAKGSIIKEPEKLDGPGIHINILA